MAETPRLLTAAEMDLMTPNERAKVFKERVVTDREQVPEELRQSIAATSTSSPSSSHDRRRHL